MNPPPVGIIQKSCRAEVLCKSLVPPWHIMNGVDLSKPRLSRLKLDEIGGFSVGSNTMSGGFRGSLERGSKMDLNLLRFFWRNLIHDYFIDPILSFSGSHGPLWPIVATLKRAGMGLQQSNNLHLPFRRNGRCRLCCFTSACDGTPFAQMLHGARA